MSSQITGIVSGFDTASIIESLMAIQRRSYDKTSEKVQMEKLKLQAYQSVNGMLSSLKDSVNSLSSQSLWNAKAATSTNESSLKATASQYAAEGSYSFRVGQLATTAQYLSKGYSSTTSKVISSGSSQTSGTLTLESSQARVDTSARLEDLNGGKGIYRGSIRITDGTGASAVVDLSTCETIDQVVSAINGAAGLQIEARIDGGSLEIVDNSGGINAMKIQNVGQGTTAADLGIAKASVGSISGSSIFYLSNDTNLSILNDGQGVEDGWIVLSVYENGEELDIYVDLTEVQTAGDVINAVNAAIKEMAASSNSLAHLADGLKFGFNDTKDGFAFSGGTAGRIYSCTNVWGQDASGAVQMANPETAHQLGLNQTFVLNADGTFTGERVLGGMSSPMLGNLSGANGEGLGSGSSSSKVTTGAVDEFTLLSSLNGGKGLDVSTGLQLNIFEAGRDTDYYQKVVIADPSELRAMMKDPTATLGDLVAYINTNIRALEDGIPALKGVELKIDDQAKGVYFDGFCGVYDYGIQNSLADSFGLTGLYSGTDAADTRVTDFYEVHNIGPSAGGSMIWESMTLDQLFNLSTSDVFTQADLDAAIADGLTITIGINGVDYPITVDLTGLTLDATVEVLYGMINAEIEQQVLAVDPNASVPWLTIELDGMGLQWANTDLTNNFKVEGKIAEFFGFNKEWTPWTFSEFETGVSKNLNAVYTGEITGINDLDDSDLLSSLNAGAGLDFTGNQLTIAFGPEGSQSIITITRSDLLGVLDSHHGAMRLDDYLDALNALVADKILAHGTLSGSGAKVEFGISADKTGITIVTAEWTGDGEEIHVGGDMASAGSTGITAMGVLTGTGYSEPVAADIRSVQTAEVPVSGLGYIRMEIGGSEILPPLNTDGLDQYSTLQDMIACLNKQLKDRGYTGMSFGVSDSGSGLSFTNDSNDEVTFLYDDFSSLASDLGLAGSHEDKTDTTVSSLSHLNASSLNRNYISRATSLSTLNGGAGADLGVITVTDAAGLSVNIDLGECLTIGDVIDAINGTFYSLNARINDTGDGIVIEQYEMYDAKGNAITGEITITNADGTKTAEHLGIAGTSIADDGGKAVLNGSMKTVIEVGQNDTLTDLMNRIADAGYKASIINDGTGVNSCRLSISASASGEAADFIIDTDLESLGLQQVSRGQDSMLLYGQPDSGMSPVMLKSSTNINNKAIQGLTLELTEASESYTTITVKTDTEGVVEEIKNMVQAYNDLSDLITYLDSYDYENETKGILFGDSTIRNLMDTIDNMFYQVFNPDNLSYTDIAAIGKKSTWSWTDIGISFSTNNTASDDSGTWYSRMELDLDALEDMVATNWDQLYEMLASQRNASNSKLASGAAATSTFNYQYDYDADGKIIKPDEEWDPDNAINGDKSGSTWGTSTNGFQANKTIDEGENQYTIYFQGATTLDRISIYHPNSADYPASEYGLKDFTVEYLDAATGQWVTHREVSGNISSSTILACVPPINALGVRITGTATNAEDGKFRLLDVQCLETTGLAGTLNRVVNSLTDVVDGYFTKANEEVEARIADLEEQMEKMNERLDLKEQSLWTKFNAMELALSKLQNQSSYLAEMFASLSSSS